MFGFSMMWDFRNELSAAVRQLEAHNLRGAMNMRRTILKVASAFAIGLLSANAGAATDLTLDDILGRWCSKDGNYTFTATELNVDLPKKRNLTHGKVLRIFKVLRDPDYILIYWSDKPDDYTKFTLSGDKTQLIQPKQTGGDNGPERIFRRC
jgi:hypothetical protein